MSLRIFNLKNMDEQEKKNLILYIEKMVVAQATQQHMEICKEWEHGKITNWKFLQEDDYPNRVLAIKYEDEKWFRYYGVDLGTEGMTVKDGLEEKHD